MTYLWLDESDKHGRFYSNFYGGVLILSQHYNLVISRLEKRIAELGICEEIKWTKVNEHWLSEYIKLLDTFFELMQEGFVKVRIFFRHNQYVPVNLSPLQKREEYQRLYYQFIKHAFGFEYHTNTKTEYLKIMIDEMPLKGSASAEFKKYLYALNNDPKFKKSNVQIKRSHVTEVNSKKHLPMQIMDVILGAICFRLNEKYKDKLPYARLGKRTKAKLKLYKTINAHIRNIMPGFNIGISTGIQQKNDIWEQPYRHWSFVPKNYERHKENTKKSSHV